MLILNSTQNGFGLDIGDKSIKLLRLVLKKTFLHKTKFIVKNYAEVSLPDGAIEKGEIQNEDLVVDSINKLIKEAGRLPSRAVIASLPESKTFLKTIQITVKNKKEIPSKIIESLPKIIPLAAEEVYFDWQIIAGDEKVKKSDFLGKSDFEKTYTIFLAAAPKTIVDNFLKILNKADLLPIALELEAVALTRALLGEKPAARKSLFHRAKQEVEQVMPPRVIIDLGATQTSLIVAESHAPAMSISLPLSGNYLTELISEKLKIDLAKAEEIKKFCGVDARKCDNKIIPVLGGFIEDICKRIFKALKTYPDLPPSTKMPPILLSGGGANMLKIDSVMARNLKIKTIKGNPFEIWGIESKNKKLNDSPLSSSTAIGLALRAVIYPFPSNRH